MNRDRLPKDAHPLLQQLDRELEKFLRLAASVPLASDEELTDELCRNGFERTFAEELVCFVPLAFGREVVEELGIPASQSYRLHSTSSDCEEEMPLSNNLVYRFARAVAADYRTEQYVELFKNVASRSAEIAVISQALEKGVSVDELKGCTLQPTTVYLSRRL